MSGDRRHHQLTFGADIEIRREGSDVVRDLRRVTFVAPRRQTGRLAGRIDTPHLHRDRGEPGHAHRQDRHQRGDRECRFDGRSTAIIAQTLVFSARLMMFVSAVTIESPVTTV